jgi:hypothetical protein
MWINCHLVCAQAIESHCSPDVEGDEQICLESGGTEPTFAGPPQISCEEISRTIKRLEGQLKALDEAESQSQ